MAIKSEAKSPQLIFQEVADMKSALEAKRIAAIEDLLQQRSEINNHLAALGYDGNLPAATASNGGGTGAIGSSKTKATKGKKASKTAGERYCPICDVTGHDARSHRSQGKRKRPFSKAELDSMTA
jgi:hypothetical protein